MDSHSTPSQNPGTPHKHKASPIELLASAKLVADAVKGDPNSNIDKGKVADAAADLLCAASHYGKMEGDQGYGKYVEKAETFLHNYSSSHSPKAPSMATDHPNPSPKKSSDGAHSEGGGGGGGGFGDYMKMAEGLLKKK